LREVLRGSVRFMSIVAGGALLFIMVTTAADVARRNLGDGRSIPGVIEYNEIMLVVLVFLSLANTQRTGDHISVSLVTRVLPHRVSCGVRAVGMSVATVFIAWMMYRSWQVGWQSYQRGEFRIGLAQVPIWPARLLIPFGLLFLLLQILLSIYDQLVGVVKGEPAVAEDDDLGGVGL
jgi:TRAP-type C4-dicarboxylate transport system permease small subunit